VTRETDAELLQARVRARVEARRVEVDLTAPSPLQPARRASASAGAAAGRASTRARLAALADESSSDDDSGDEAKMVATLAIRYAIIHRRRLSTAACMVACIALYSHGYCTGCCWCAGSGSWLNAKRPRGNGSALRTTHGRIHPWLRQITSDSSAKQGRGNPLGETSCSADEPAVSTAHPQPQTQQHHQHH
jgi:hypothetical protein